MTEYPTPVKGKILIKKDEPVSKTASGIILRPTDRTRSYTGTLVSTGEKIVFVARVSSTVNFRGENLTIISDNDIVGTYES